VNVREAFKNCTPFTVDNNDGHLKDSGPHVHLRIAFANSHLLSFRCDRKDIEKDFNDNR
jgi:hypothetical protein